MLLSIRFPDRSKDEVEALLPENEERLKEFWFGRGLAWSCSSSEGPAVHLSLVVEVPRIVGRTKRRDRDERLAVNYCDSYPYAASGLMALFLSRLQLVHRAGPGREKIAVEFSSYSSASYGVLIAQRLLAPLGYSVQVVGKKLRFEAERGLREALVELPILLLTLDRRTRLFLSPDELGEIASPGTEWIQNHPAVRAFELSIAGRPIPFRQLVPGHTWAASTSTEQEETSELLVDHCIQTADGKFLRVDRVQREHALQAFSRVNIDRKWLIYLPAAVASQQGNAIEDELESPAAALTYFRDEYVAKAVVQEKHMGSRGIVVLCRSAEAARIRFGVDSEVPGCAYTRNGRKFFRDEDTEAVFLDRIGQGLTKANFWSSFSTDWVCFDGEILPWAIKASETALESDLVEAGLCAFNETLQSLEAVGDSSTKAYWLMVIERERSALLRYEQMFKRYRNEEVNLAALKFAPFHLLATEGQSYFGRSHLWHMETLNHLARAGGGLLRPTRYEVVETGDPRTWNRMTNWWEELSASGEEGFVVKPLPFVPKGRRGQAQPALKCRSREHLRLVYGPQYDSREMSELLRSRGAIARRRNKHRRILRQFALAIEAVRRFVKRDSMNAVHDCVLGVLAQEVPPGANLT